MKLKNIRRENKLEDEKWKNDILSIILSINLYEINLQLNIFIIAKYFNCGNVKRDTFYFTQFPTSQNKTLEKSLRRKNDIFYFAASNVDTSFLLCIRVSASPLFRCRSLTR